MTDAGRPFTAERYRLTATVELRALRDGEEQFIAARLAEMDPWQSLRSTPEGLERYLKRHDPCLSRYALWQEDRLIGVIAVRTPWLRGAYLELLSVFDEAQGQGVGHSLIKWLAAEGSRAGTNLWATVSASNQRARRFYERYGFVPIGDIPDLVRAGCTEILLRLPLVHN
jgi:ribosomal protein S18 acetylase RimI-like enzyme